MAKFKVSDKVRDKYGKHQGGVVTKVTPSDIYVDFGDGTVGTYSENELIAANSALASTNPVVQNALTALNGYHVSQYVKGGWYVIGFSGNKDNPLIDDQAGRGENYIFPTEQSAKRFIDTVLKKMHPRATFTVDEDRGVAFGRGPGRPNMNSRAANAVARNAKFKVGDRVKDAFGDVGEVIEILSNGNCKVKQGAHWYIYGPDEIKAVNAMVARNAAMTADQAVAAIKGKTKVLRDINAKVLPWRKEMEKMRQIWDKTDIDFLYGDDNYRELIKKPNVKLAIIEYRDEQNKGYYNFSTIG